MPEDTQQLTASAQSHAVVSAAEFSTAEVKRDYDLMASMNRACKIMGVKLWSSEQFVRAYLEWVTHHGSVEIQRVEDCWSITGGDAASADETLIWAICGHVFGVNTAEESR